MKKILFIHHSGNLSGAGWSLLYTIKALDTEKYNAQVLFLERGKVVELFNLNHVKHFGLQNKENFKGYIRLVHIEPAYLKWYKIIQIIKTFMWWYKVSNHYARTELNLLEYDIIHLNSISLIDWARAAKLDGKKVIIHIREPLANGLLGLRKYFIRKQLRLYCDRIITISKDNAKRVGLPNKTSVVYNFSDFEKFNPNVKPLFPKENKYFYILYMGGALKYKGYEVMVKSIRHLDKNVRIVLAGNYQRFDKRGGVVRFKRLVNRYINGVPSFHKLIKDSRVKYVGLTTEVSNLIQSCDAVLFPAIKTHFPRPLIEGMVMKKIPVAFDIEGIDEVFRDKKDGVVIEKMNSRSLADGVNKVASMDKVKYHHMAESSYQFAKSRFSVKNIRQISKIYDEL